MKVIFYTKYSNKGASSRLRSFQYFPYLKEHGLEVKVKPLFNDLYLERLYAGKNVLLAIIIAYVNRFVNLWWIFWADRIVIEKELFPYFPAWFEHLLATMGKHYIVDYDDAIFHNYDRNSNFMIRKFLKNKIDTVMKYADVVVAGNTYLANRAKEAGAKNIVIVPTVIDLNRYVVPQAKNGEKFIVGWIGTKSTFEKHLLSIKDWLIKAQNLFDIEVHIIGITENNIFLGNHVKYIPWSEETEVVAISNIDVGIMPLQNSPWEAGKCAYKIIQYMACGKPVITSDVGVNAEVCINGETGFLANTEEEFLTALSFLIHNKPRREIMGNKGRILVEEIFNIEKTSETVIKIILGKN